MTPNNVTRVLRDLATDLTLADGSPTQVDALYYAISAIEAHGKADWLAADKHRDEVRRMANQLDAISKICQTMADKLADVTVARGYQRDSFDAAVAELQHAMEVTARKSELAVNDAFDSIFHPSFYRKMNHD
jgi:hypothetical protein